MISADRKLNSGIDVTSFEFFEMLFLSTKPAVTSRTYLAGCPSL